jgi:hypothetical protein
MARRRAVLLFLPAIDQAKQERAMLGWARDQGCTVTAVTHVPAAATALAEDGLVDVVILVRHTRASLEMAGRIGQTGATVEELRPARTPLVNHDRTRGQILDAAARGVSAEAIAAVLDVPVSTVHEALGIDRAQPSRRPREVARRPKLTLIGPPGRP